MTATQRARIDERLRQPVPAPDSVADMRAGYAALMARMAVPSDIRTAESELAGRRALVVEPTATTPRAGTILFFHGGSFIVGSPETELGLTASLVTRTGVTAWSLDYRLAPEHPFPAGIEDCVAAYRTLLDDGAAPAGIVLAGDSAGGGLVVSSLLAARREGLPMPAAAVLFSPGLDSARTGASLETRAAADPIFTRERLLATSALYRAGADPDQELLSPASHADLHGFPPLLVQVGTNEVLLDDSTRLAERARDADVDVILDVTAGVPHVFQTYVGELEEADRALDRAALFVVQHLDRAGD